MDPKKFLAEAVLNERKSVTYRLLSRAAKVHAHRAKQILFEFHKVENAKRPQSVHATYVIAGVQKPPASPDTNGQANDEDEVMQSSPYLPSSMPNQEAIADSVEYAAITLAREEDLEDAKATFKSISSIHVYSVQPTVLQDLNTLIDVAREIATTYAQDDPLEHGKQWGMIQNRNVKRRTGARPPPPPAASAPKAKLESTVPAKRPLQAESTATPEAKSEEPKSQPMQNSASQSDAKSNTKTAPSKQGKGNLFSSFAKAKPPKKKAEAPPQPAESNDVVLDDASEEEQEELFPESSGKPHSNRESKKEREDKLKAMMEADDDDEADDEEMPDADDEPVREPTPVEQPPPPKPAELKEEATTQGGRRRGKRQVMKKVQMKDEEGYLVTREEPSWESFSEDEPVPKKKPAVSAPKAKPGAKAGQGNIMSFFGKK